MLTTTMSKHQHQLGDETYLFNKKRFLTQREKDVLSYLAAGKRPDQIAFDMNLTIPTINLHIQKAKKRLGAATREQAVSTAIIRREIEP